MEPSVPELSANEVLERLKTVDGAGSGVDADLLDGAQSAAAATASTVPVRDGAGRMKAADGSAADDVATKGQLDTAVAGLLDYQGGYDASTNTPDLDTSPSGINKGDAYTVTAAGNFFTDAVDVGDMLIAEVDNPTVLTDWTVVSRDIDAASTSAKGIVELATDGETGSAVVPTGDDSRLANNEKTTNKDTDGGYVGRDGSGNATITGTMTASKFASDVHDELVETGYTQADASGPTTFASFAHGTYQGAFFEYVIRRGTAHARIGTLVVIHNNGSAVSVDDTGKDEVGGGNLGITWSAAVNGANIDVRLEVDNSDTDDVFLVYRAKLMKVYSA